MAKTFDLDLRKGTLIDSVSKGKGTNSGSSFAKGEKGNQLKIGTSKYVNYPAQILPDGAFSVVVWFKMNNEYSAGTTGIISNTTAGTYTGTICVTNDALGNKPVIGFALGNYRYWNVTPKKEYQCYVFTVPSADQTALITAQLFVDGVLDTGVGGKVTSAVQGARTGFTYVGGGSSTGSANIARIKVYDTVLTQTEVNKEQIEFLQSYGTTEQKRNFTYPKPTDTSYEEGLVAHYNMVPSK